MNNIYRIQIETKRDVKKDIIGKYIRSHNGEVYIVEDYAFQKNGELYYQIRFIKDGYRTFSTYRNAKRGYASDPYVCDGIMGTSWGDVDMSYPNLDKIKLRYDDMFDRIYNPKNKGYNKYGGSGLQVDPLWWCFENYLRDVTSQKGFHPALLCKDNFIQLDKDYMQQSIERKSDMVYSKYTAIWLIAGMNSGFTKRETYKYNLIAPNEEIYYLLDDKELIDLLSTLSDKALAAFIKNRSKISKKSKDDTVALDKYTLKINK